jgi:signal transduction histidine kinase
MNSRGTAAFRRLRWLLPAALALCSAGDALTPPAEPLARLRDVQSFMLLAVRAAREVDLEGVVTHFDAERGELYLHDASGPGAFAVGDLGAPVWAGGLVSLRGVLDPASRTPTLRRPQLTVLAQPSVEHMPEPRKVDAATLLALGSPAEWVEVRGVLLSAVERPPILHLDLQEGGRRFHAHVSIAGSGWPPWPPDSRLRLRGVRPAAGASGAAPDVPQVLVGGPGDLRIDEDPPSDPFALPLASLAQLAAPSSEPLPDHRVRVRGVLRRFTGEQSFVLAAQGRELAVVTEERTTARAGDGIDVVGFARPGAAGVSLTYALVRSSGDLGAPPPAVSRRVLRTAAEVRRLTSDQAREGHPVRLQGVVTFNDPELSLLFVQDRTAGIYVEAWRHIHHVQAGDRVEVEGVSAPGNFVPIVDRPRIRVVGRGPLPPARRVRPPQLRAGLQDSQWVEVEGVVRSMSPRRRFTVIKMAEDGVRFQLDLPPQADPALARRLVDARVRVRAVCRSVFTLKGQFADFALSSPGLEQLTVLTPPSAEPFARTVLPVNSLFQFVPGQNWAHRVRVQGTVTFSQSGDLYLRDESGGLRVRTSGGPLPEVGEEIDAIGFAGPGEYSPVLEDAEVRARGRRSDARPVAITPEQAMRGGYDGELVQLEARLLEHVPGPEGRELSLRAGQYVFTAPVRGSAPWPRGLRPGSGLRLTGVCRVSANEQRVPRSFQLLLRSPADIEVPHPGPWWTPRQAAWALGAMVGVVALTLVWVVTLRRHANTQKRIIWQQVKRETELQERQRMARELHDTLEQNLTGISLSLEAASLTLQKSPEMAEQHLGRALVHVDRSIEEVHRSVWALREESLEAHGLAASLDELGQRLASCSASPIAVRTRVEGNPCPFALTVENHLLHIGQEALTNAVKHGKAAHIEVTLTYSERAFRLRVRDDGRGFNALAPAPEGRLGLLGMRERALEIGGRVEVLSGVGRGTEVQVWVPLAPMSMSQAG